MSELHRLAYATMASRAADTFARLHVRAGGNEADISMIRRVASELWAAGQSGQLCLRLSKLQEVTAPDALIRSPLVQRLSPGSESLDRYPLVLEGDRLYPLRHWRAEDTIARGLLELARAQGADSHDPAIVSAAFDQSETDENQRRAVATAFERRLLVLSGGPGTGKTTTLGATVRALATHDSTLRIALAAPTGKATTRLSSAIGANLSSTRVWASTLHRLLGYQANGQFLYGADNPLPYDVIVVDECSMVDARLGAQLIAALAPFARLILAGDKDQLSSVEPGAFYGALCAVATEPVASCIVILERNYRQQGAPQIAHWARAVRQNSLTTDPPESGVHVYLHSLGESDSPNIALDLALNLYLPLVRKASEVVDPLQQAQLLAEFEQIRVLCAMRIGSCGADAINRQLIERLQQQLSLNATLWFPGRLVIITQNLPSVGLFNGDIGLVTRDESGQLSVLFDAASDSRRLLPLQMPAHDDAFALTVHQSQGSDFATVLFIPAPAEHPLATRAGAYTGITRAREQLHIYAEPADLRWAAASAPVGDGALTARIDVLSENR